MYTHFFGFQTKPFQLVPNPGFLFLSRTHEEALAHFKYSILQGNGFMVVTGEVGTGKTTLCRVFLDGLPESVQVAYIFNPKLNDVQLLQAICDEFGLPSPPANVKELVDCLNLFLIKQKTAGRTCVLLIDEAQNLERDILEQLRLLSNLETSTEKLLQIILVGQPELLLTLGRHEMRQLRQRITVNCRLLPLCREETRRYIHHRLRQAGVGDKAPKFTSGALRRVYAYSGGTPRLINVICDRALLMAYTANRREVRAGDVNAARHELEGTSPVWQRALHPAALALFLAVFLGAATYLGMRAPEPVSVAAAPEESKEPSPPPQQPPVLSAQAVVIKNGAPDKQKPEPPAQTVSANSPPATVRAPAPSATPQDDPLHAVLLGLSTRSSLQNATAAALSRWGVENFAPPPEDLEHEMAYLRSVARQAGLELYRFLGTPEKLLAINLPAVIKFKTGTTTPYRYLALQSTREESFLFANPAGTDGRLEVSAAELQANWYGIAFVFWRDSLELEGTPGKGADAGTIAALRRLLLATGYQVEAEGEGYDQEMRHAVMDVQQRHGVTVDGIVGPLTKILLYNEADRGTLPHLYE